MCTWQKLGKRVLSFPEREPAACSVERIRNPPLGLLRRWRPQGRHWCLQPQVDPYWVPERTEPKGRGRARRRYWRALFSLQPSSVPQFVGKPNARTSLTGATHISPGRGPSGLADNGTFFGQARAHGKVTFCAGALAPALCVDRGRTGADERPAPGRHRSRIGPAAGDARGRASLPPPPGTSSLPSGARPTSFSVASGSPSSSTAASGMAAPSMASAGMT